MSSVSKPGNSQFSEDWSVAVVRFLVSVLFARPAVCALAVPQSHDGRFSAVVGRSMSQWVGWDASVRLMSVRGRRRVRILTFCSCCVQGAYGCSVA